MKDIGSGSVDDSVIKGKTWADDGLMAKQGLKANRGMSAGFNADVDNTLPGPGDDWGSADDKGSVAGDSGGSKSAFGDDDGAVISSGGLSFGQQG